LRKVIVKESRKGIGKVVPVVTFGSVITDSHCARSNAEGAEPTSELVNGGSAECGIGE